MKNISLFIMFATLATVVFYGAGCNPFEAAQEKAQEKVEEKMAEKMLESMGGEGVDVDLDEDGEKATVKVKNEDGDGEMLFGDEVELPDDLSDSIMIYDNAVPVSVIRNLGGEASAMIALKTEDSLKDVANWYVDKYETEGWEQEQSVDVNGTKMLGWVKDDEQLLVTFGKEEDGLTVISINWSMEE